MGRCPESAVERPMKEEVLRAMGGQISWVQAGEILTGPSAGPSAGRAGRHC